jgi:hypothetical protein
MKLENWLGIGAIAVGVYIVYKVSKGTQEVYDDLKAGSSVGYSGFDSLVGGVLPGGVSFAESQQGKILVPIKNKVVDYWNNNITKKSSKAIKNATNLNLMNSNSYIPKTYSGTAVQISNAGAYTSNIAGQPSFVQQFGNKVSVMGKDDITSKQANREKKYYGYSTTVTYNKDGTKTKKKTKVV